MVTAKLAFVLIQVGSNLWVNPMQVQGVALANTPRDTCQCVILVTNLDGVRCSDWSIEKVREALSTAAVAKAMEGK